MSQRQMVDEAASQLDLDGDQRASLLVLHVDPYVEWLKTGKGLEISRRRLMEITETLKSLAYVFNGDSDRARQWLYSRETTMRPKIPAAVLRVGKVGEVRDHVENMMGFT